MNQLSEAQQAAVFLGFAMNRGYPVQERLEMALQALNLYEKVVEQLQGLVESYTKMVKDSNT